MPCIQGRGDPTQTPRTCSSRPQSLRSVAVSVARASVRWMQSTARSAVSRGKKSTPTVATKIIPNQRTKVPACLFSGVAMVRPTLRVTLCQARRSATMRSVPAAVRTMSSVYMCAVCMRASSTPE
eukprot:6212578-Pleurochrysis_carterae.AAC.1